MPVFLYQENSLAANFLISSESLEGFKRAGWSRSLLLFAQRKLFSLVFPTKLGHNEAGEVKGTGEPILGGFWMEKKDHTMQSCDLRVRKAEKYSA